MATLGLGLGSQLNANLQEMRQRVFDFTITLSQENNNNAQTVAHWLTQENSVNYYSGNLESISLVLNAPLTFEAKIEHLLQLKTNLEKKAIENDAAYNAREQQWKKEAKKAQQIREIKNFINFVFVATVLPAIIVMSAETGAQVVNHWNNLHSLKPLLFLNS